MAAPLSGPSFFDEQPVLERYRQIRGRADAPHRTLEEPVVLTYLGDVRGLSILDLGCGDAWIGRHALERGALRYVGIDGSRQMVNLAQLNLAGFDAEVRHQNLETWCGGHDERFDAVVSRLVFQYLENFSAVLEVIRHHLLRGGRLVFSIEHPIMTSSFERETVEDVAVALRLHDYFREGQRTDQWLGADVLKQHRALETYVGELRRCGFTLEEFSEGRPRSDRFANPDSHQRYLHVPLCAIFRCVRE